MTVITSARGRSLGPVSMRIAAASGAIGVATLFGMYGCFAAGATEPALTLGFINDVSIIVTYPAALPGLLAIRRAVRRRRPLVADAGTAVALGGMGLTLVAQALLVTGVVPFERQVAWATAGFLLFGAWLVASGWLERRSSTLPYGPGLGLGATVLVGFPTWALRVARWMESERP